MQFAMFEMIILFRIQAGQAVQVYTQFYGPKIVAIFIEIWQYTRVVPVNRGLLL